MMKNYIIKKKSSYRWSKHQYFKYIYEVGYIEIELHNNLVGSGF